MDPWHLYYDLDGDDAQHTLRAPHIFGELDHEWEPEDKVGNRNAYHKYDKCDSLQINCGLKVFIRHLGKFIYQKAK